MAKLTQIDSSKSLTFMGCRFGKSSDPRLLSWAEKFNEPNMVMVSEPQKDMMFTVNPGDTPAVLQWLSETKRKDVFEEHLQSIAETAEGEPLYSSWIQSDMALINAFAEDLAGTGVAVLCGLSDEIRRWVASGANEVALDGYVLGGYGDW